MKTYKLTQDLLDAYLATNVPAGQTVSTLGGTALNDGAGATWITTGVVIPGNAGSIVNGNAYDQRGNELTKQVQATDASANEVLANGSTIARGLSERFGSMLQPEDFGAVGDVYLPDGSLNPNPTDDTQALIDYFSATTTITADKDKTYSVEGIGNWTDLAVSTNAGLIIDARGRSNFIINNLNIRIADRNPVRSVSCMIFIIEEDGCDFEFNNCHFDANGFNQPATGGGGDGDIHNVMFSYILGVDVQLDFIQTGDITFNRCEFVYPVAYGIYLQAAENKLTLNNCKSTCYGLFGALFNTNLEVNDHIAWCNYLSRPSGTTTLSDFVDDEMEFRGDYAGTKKVTRLFKNVTYNNDAIGTPSNDRFAIHKIYDVPQRGLRFDKIEFINCHAYSPLSDVPTNERRVIEWSFDGATASTKKSVVEQLRMYESGGGQITDASTTNTTVSIENIHIENPHHFISAGTVIYVGDVTVTGDIYNFTHVLDMTLAEMNELNIQNVRYKQFTNQLCYATPVTTNIQNVIAETEYTGGAVDLFGIDSGTITIQNVKWANPYNSLLCRGRSSAYNIFIQVPVLDDFFATHSLRTWIPETVTVDYNNYIHDGTFDVDASSSAVNGPTTGFEATLVVESIGQARVIQTWYRPDSGTLVQTQRMSLDKGVTWTGWTTP